MKTYKFEGEEIHVLEEGDSEFLEVMASEAFRRAVEDLVRHREGKSPGKDPGGSGEASTTS